jgi:hypothetical protein
MSEERAEYKVSKQVEQAVGRVLREDRRKIVYRPEWKEVTGSVNATILLQQVMFWWEKQKCKPFYKFFQPPKKPHQNYKNGDSWVEELGFTISELRGALDKVGKRLTKDDCKNLEKALSGVFFGYFTDQHHLTWFYFNENYFNQQMSLIYTKSPNQDSLSGKSPSQDSSSGEIRNPDLAKSGILSSIPTENTMYDQKRTRSDSKNNASSTGKEREPSDHLDTYFSSTGEVSEATGPNPQDQWLEFRNRVIKNYASSTGIKLNQEQKGELGLLSGEDGFNFDIYEKYLAEFAGRGGYAYDVKAFVEGYWVYKETGDVYKAMGRKPRPTDNGNKTVVRTDDGGYYF